MDSSKRADNDMRNSEQPWLLRVFIKLPHNSSIFIRFTGSFLALLVYVDDVILAGISPDEITVIKSHLHNVFKIKDLGELHYFLGLEFSSYFFGSSPLSA